MLRVISLLKTSGATAGLPSGASIVAENTAGQASSGTHFSEKCLFRRTVLCCHVCQLSALLLLTGCGGSEQYAPVSGAVIMDGEPLVGGHVLFQPMASPDDINPGMPSKGVTDAQGRYSLRLVQPDRDGALIGKHRVKITIPSEENVPGDVSVPVFKMPQPWRSGTKQREVPPDGTDSMDFEITTTG